MGKEQDDALDVGLMDLLLDATIYIYADNVSEK